MRVKEVSVRRQSFPANKSEATIPLNVLEVLAVEGNHGGTYERAVKAINTSKESS